MKAAIIFILVAMLSAASLAQVPDYTRYVNPFIGTGGHGHTFPGAVLPFGMVQLSPDTRGADWDGSSGYHYSDSVIYGFSHTHLSGTGIPDGCDILFMPTVGRQLFTKGGYASRFSHANEKAVAGFYSVKLDNGILAELTATKRVGFHRYSFPKGSDANLVLDLKWRDKVISQSLDFVGNNRVEGFRRSTSWAKDQVVFFVAEFSRPFNRNEVDMEADSGEKPEQKGGKFNFRFNLKDGDQLLVKVAISFVSIEGARKNLAAELPGWDFDKVRADAKAAWNKELSKIEVSGGTPDQMATFYTALYHTMIHPSLFNDVDGNYRGLDGNIHNINTDGINSTAQPNINPKSKIQNPKFQNYTVFSLWDTFRAAHPLYTIIDQRRTVDFINTFIRMYEQGGRLPVWELWGNETDTMIGYHAVSVIADAMAKGIKGFDYEKAYQAAKHSAELDHFGLAAYKHRGYISMEDANESVSKTLEYAYDDWCIVQIAEIISQRRIDFHNLREATKSRIESLAYANRARYFQNLFDPSTGFMRPKKNGGFVSPFAANEVTFNYTEGNAWVYSFFVPQDIARLIELEGGREKFAAKLDELFSTADKLTGREQPDITGLIGQYAHGNEPSHHIAYLYDYAGQPWKTQKYVRQILDDFYKPLPDGLIGNEDCGQMSAWYVLSASGFYEVTPGSGIYALGTPLFPQVKYHLENGKTFIIRASNASATNVYIKSARLNNSPYANAFVTHDDIMKGGVLEFAMSATPVKTAFTEFPLSWIDGASTAVPIIEGERVFKDKTTVTIRAIDPEAAIYFTTDGNAPTRSSKIYSGPILIADTAKINAFAYSAAGNQSPVVEADFHKRPNDWVVKIYSKYSYQYTGGGDEGLIDGIRGTVNFASGEWQGYQGQDLVAVVDLQRPTEIHRLGGGFLQDARSWIWMPTRVEFELSDDNQTWHKAAEIKTDVPLEDMNPTIRDFARDIAPTKARYVRVTARNIGKIPAWHPGAGGDAWIFVDEISVN